MTRRRRAGDRPVAPFVVRPGSRYPVGATWTREGTNFSVFSRDAIGMELLLWIGEDPGEPTQVITLDPRLNRSFFFWHVFVADLPTGTLYNWRVTLPGARHEVLDPWARAVDDRRWDRARAVAAPADSPLGLRAVLVDSNDFRWGRERPPGPGLAGAVIYELHVGGFTSHPSAGVKAPGSFAGLIEKIPYLQDLGVTHVQLLPVAAFDDQDVPPAVAARGLRNYWGYSPHSFCSPHPGYGGDRRGATRPNEFRALVNALHEAGLGVILDVVMNHTAEGGAGGPVINFKGLAPGFFYHRNGEGYRDFTGCGNTINCNHPLVTQLLVNTLERWVEEMHVDAFRFDLASVFVRGEGGEPMRFPPLPWAIEFSRVLADIPLIAEAWDAGGLYHVGSFPGLAWSEWNGRYRDVIRRFVRGDPDLTGEVATALAGSSDLYQDDDRLTLSSINFITCHDGFTLADLVSYNEKHNWANGEDNRDGSDHNYSWNCGVEGETVDPAVLALRQRQARNFVAILLLSQGVPMLLAGDEVLRSQRGNNNAWCQDNEISWFDWRLTETNGAMLRFTRELIALRRRHPTLQRLHFLTGGMEPARGIPDIRWHGTKPGVMPWEERGSRFLAFTLAGVRADEEDLHVILNMGTREVTVDLPAIAGRQWCRAVDTSRPPPGDVTEKERQSALGRPRYRAAARSVVVLESRP